VQPRPAAGRTAGPSHGQDLQGVLLYAATTVSFFTKFFTGEHITVTDAAGATWRTGDIYETSVLLTVYGMFFIALLALLRIAHRRSQEPRLTTAPIAAKQVQPSPARLPE
jgi:putative membrane protein